MHINLHSENQWTNKFLYLEDSLLKEDMILDAHTSLNINMKSKALSTPTNWPLEKSQRGAIGIPWKQLT
jgi:hypothetical protein